MSAEESAAYYRRVVAWQRCQMKAMQEAAMQEATMQEKMGGGGTEEKATGSVPDVVPDVPVPRVLPVPPSPHVPLESVRRIESVRRTETEEREVSGTETGGFERGGAAVVPEVVPEVACRGRSGPVEAGPVEDREDREDREVMVRSRAVGEEVEALKRALEDASRERDNIAGLFDRIETDPKGVASAVKLYFETVKKREAGLLSGRGGVYGGAVYAGEDHGGEEKKEGERDERDFGADDRSFGSASTSGSRRSSHHFANDTTMLPAAFASKPLDTKTLRLLGESIWSPKGKMSNETTMVKETKAHHYGAVQRSTVPADGPDHHHQERSHCGALVRSRVPATARVRGGRVKAPPRSPLAKGLPGFMLPTAAEKERGNQPRPEPGLWCELRGEGERRRERESEGGRAKVVTGSRQRSYGGKAEKIVKPKRPTFKKVKPGVAGL